MIAPTTLPIDIVGSTIFGQYEKISVAETYNMYISDDGLVPYPGYKKRASIVEGGRGREIYNSPIFKKLFLVVNDGLYIMDTSFNVTRVATLDTFVGNAFIAENEAGEIAIADGLNIYVFNYNTAAFTKISAATLGFQPVYIAYQDGYGIAADGNSNRWFLSNPNDFTMWPSAAANVGALETKPDRTLATVPFNRQLYVFGSIVAEQWNDQPFQQNQLFPYVRNSFLSLDYGALSSASIASGFGLLVWLAANEKSGASIMVSTGGQPQQISTDGINFKLNNLSNPTNCFGFLMKIDGHIFYQFSFPDDSLSYAYDFNTNKFFTLGDENMNSHIAKRVAFFNNAYFFLSYRDAGVYQFGSQFTSYDGKEIHRVRKCSHTRLDDASRFRCKRLSITLEQGNQKRAGTPQVVDLSISRDGGVAFSNIIRKQMKTQANRANVMQFFQLGATNDFVPQFSFWSPDRFVVTKATLDIEQ